MTTQAHPMHRVDNARAVTNVALALAQPIAAYFSEWSGRGVSDFERSQRSSGPVTPAPGTFAIWGPLFIESVRYAAWSARRDQREDEALQRIGWLTSATFASTSAWSVNAQLRGLGWPSVGLITLGAASSTAALLDATRRPDDPTARRAARSIAPLAGWLTLASFANLEATLNETGGRPAPRVEASRAMLMLGAATVTAGAVTLASKGSPLYAGAVAWGLAGTIARNLKAKEPLVAAVAGAGIAALAAATLFARRRAASERQASITSSARPSRASRAST